MMLFEVVLGFYLNWRIYEGNGLDQITDKTGFFNFKCDDKRKQSTAKIDRIDEDGYSKLTIATTGTKTFIEIPISSSDYIFGMGEQFTHWNLKGKRIRNVPREDGIGRKGFIKWAIQLQTGKQELDASYIISPFFLTSSGLAIAIENQEYAEFDFRPKNHILLKINSNLVKLTWFIPSSMIHQIQLYTQLYGRQPITLPKWTQTGAIIAQMGGTDRSTTNIKKLLDFDINISGIWIQDWSGLRKHSIMGLKHWRVNWDWRGDDQLYSPSVASFASYYQKQDIKVLGYVSPFIMKESSLYEHALKNNFLAKNHKGLAVVNQGPGFDAYMIDLINKDAYKWFRSVIIENMNYLDGFMADFGEYYPYMYTNSTEHVEFIKIYTQLVTSINKFSFMRCGTLASSKHPLYWSGDQMHTFSKYDGLQGVLQGYLQAGLSGYGIIHSDIGGITSVGVGLNNFMVGYKRNFNVLVRWMEFSVFEAVYRTHEGSIPYLIEQVYSTNATMSYFKTLSSHFVALQDYRQELFIEYSKTGLGLFRPLYLYFKDMFDVSDQFMYGEHVLVAPVLSNDIHRTVKIPDGLWRHVGTKQVYTKGEHFIKSDYGQTPVFISEDHFNDPLFTNYIKLVESSY